jgi:hypothetical protein
MTRQVGETYRKGKITMNLKIHVAVALFLTCSLSPVLHAGSLTTEVVGMFPQDARELAYVNLRQARSLTWFRQFQKEVLPEQLPQFEQLLALAGEDSKSHVEELAWALVPAELPAGAAQNTAAGEVVVSLAIGQFGPESVANYFQAQKRTVVKVRGYSLYPFGNGSGDGGFFFCFMDSTTAALGPRKELEKLLAVRYGEEQSLLSNTELAPLISQANGSAVLWSVLSAPYARVAMQQFAPQATQFPQTQQIVSALRGLTIEISAGSDVQMLFEAVCTSSDDANLLAALLQAGLLYQGYQAGNSNQNLAAMLGQAKVAPSGDRLDLTMTLTDDQVVGLIQRNTFAVHR